MTLYPSGGMFCTFRRMTSLETLFEENKQVVKHNGVGKGGIGVKPTPLSLIFYKNFITCAKEINCFRIHVMALGHYMREKSTESKGDSPAESTQTAETIESGSAGTAGKTRKGGQKQGKKPKGESRNK